MADSKTAPLRPPIDDLPAQERRAQLWLLLSIAAGITLLHVFTNNKYGFHRDELQVLADARHLDWGFVAYPPLTPVIARIGLSIFGVSMVGLRLFSVLAQSAAAVIGGLIAFELGGKRTAQITTTLAIAFSPVPMFESAQFQYTSFDFLLWVLISYLLIRLLNSGNPRWWVAIGASAGLGLENKYIIVFLVAGIVAGIVLTPTRRHLKSGWFWTGIALALLICLPNLIWQVRHDLISYRFLQYIHARDIAWGRTATFWHDQFLMGANPAAIPLWAAGFLGFLLDRRYRLLAFATAVPIVLLWLSHGRGYYTGGVYPVMVAMGIVTAERWINWLPPLTGYTVKTAWCAFFALAACYLCAILVPLASAGRLYDFMLSQNAEMREEIGWTDLVQTVAQIRDALPPEQRGSVGILTGNYGEQGAIEILGSAYRLPTPIGVTNSAWLRGYPNPAPTTLIVVGFSRENAERTFTGCRLAGHNGNRGGVRNEESQYHPDIFVCGPPREGWPAFWRSSLSFG